MKVPCCSVCQTRYNEEERVPLLLQCGHGFCKDCLSKMFTGSTDTTLACPRCRHVSLVGNSVQALRKNYPVLALLGSNSFDCDYTDDDDDDGDDEDDGGGDRDNDGATVDGDGVGRRGRRVASCGRVIDVGAHPEVKLVRKIGEGKRVGVGTWAASISGPGVGKCKHRLAVKRVEIGEEMEVEWVQGQLESLRRSSMWCRNVCCFHGVVRMDGCFGLVMDRCYGSVQSEMQHNEGRLTLEQILRLFLFIFFALLILALRCFYREFHYCLQEKLHCM